MPETGVVAVFLLVYLGMFLGELPGLKLDRTGVALLGAVVLLGTGTVTLDEAAAAIDVPTMAILFAFMVISAQLRLGGFFGFTAGRLAGWAVGPSAVLAGVIVVVAALAAVFSNDVVCLAVGPVLLDACRRRGLSPVPYLLALACAANIGSAATLIGNPQNILVGEALRLDFGAYLATAALPTLAGLAITWGVVRAAFPLVVAAEPVPGAAAHEPFDAWQSAKGLAVALALLAVFLLTDWPREVAALAGAGVLLASRRVASRDMLGQVDWQLLVLFAGLFVVNAALQATPAPAAAVAWLQGLGVDIAAPGWFFATTVVLSNLVSNVPAVMLLLPVSTFDAAGPLLAVASTLAGNLLIVGSIANIIVVENARRAGVAIDWRTHARVGLPVGLLSLAVAAGLLVR
jgi:Na+/H+ antiporter NhaD/arsenite permease-like protein